MITEIDLLEKEIPRLEMKFGKANVFVELLKTQLAFLQKQAKHRAQRRSRHRPHVVDVTN